MDGPMKQQDDTAMAVIQVLKKRNCSGANQRFASSPAISSIKLLLLKKVK